MVAITDGATIQISDRLPEQAEANRQIALRAFRFLATPPEYRDEAEAEAVFAPELEMLGPARDASGCHRSARPGRDLFAGFSEPSISISKMTASGDRVISQVRFHGRHTGWYEGRPPTGRTMTADGLVVHRIKDGRVVEQWSFARWQ